MTRYIAHLRTPAAIDSVVAAPYVEQMLQDPGDGEVQEQDGGAEQGGVAIAFEADDVADAELHARLLAERAPGVEVVEVVAA